jgi:PHD/YefM family antitoxin component YafN of YafNO toxin-antitoxin module
MQTLHPQFITDTAGQKLVVLPVSEFNSILEELEELDDIRVYDEAKKEDDGERTSFVDYLKERNTKHG